MSSIMALLVALSICLMEFSRAALFHHSCFCLPLKSWLLQSAAMMISKGFKWETWKKRSVCWLMIPPVFCRETWSLFRPFLILWINLLLFLAAKSICPNQIHIGSLRNSDVFPFQDSGLRWGSNTFKTLGINFSLNVNSLYDLNFVPKLRQIEQTLNCWKHRNLSLIGKVTVIKSLLLPQLLYLFSVLCINIPKTFFKKLNHLFYKLFGMAVKSWIISFISLFGMAVMIGLNVIFFIMTMIMVVCGCLIHFYFSKLKNLFGLSNCLTPTTPVFGKKLKCPF